MPTLSIKIGLLGFTSSLLILWLSISVAMAGESYRLFGDKERESYFGVNTEIMAKAPPLAEKERPSVKAKSFWKVKSRWLSAKESAASVEDLGLYATLFSEITIGRHFGFVFQGQVEGHSGQVQSVFEVDAENEFFITQGYGYWKPHRNIVISGGAHVQEFAVGNRLVFRYNRTFPGLVERFQFGNDKLYGKLLLQQAILVSRNLATRTTDIEPTPTVYTERLSMGWRPHRRADLSASIMHFQFNDLPHSVALDSMAFGNTIDSSGPGTQRFRYEFNGGAASLGGEFELAGETYLLLNTTYVENFEAPTHRNQGQLSSLGVSFPLFTNLSIKPFVERFVIQSDVVPAFFNDGRYGHNNRDGYGVGIEAYLKKYDIKLGARYIESGTIEDNRANLQSDQYSFMFSVETGYEEI